MYQLFNDDCMNILSQLEDKSIDLVIIDPPYSIATSGGGGSFGTDKRSYHKSIQELSYGIKNCVLEELCRVMKKINIYIWCNKEQLKQYMDFFIEKGCKAELLTWHKTNPVPTCNNKYLSDTEYLLFFREKGVKLFGSYATKKKYYISPTNKKDKDRYRHPTIKPLSILKNLVLNSSNEGDIVLDCFMGSGSTGVACLETNRRFIGVEIEKEYFSVANERINETLYQGDKKWV